MCAQLYVFFAVQTISSFWWDLENFSQKSVPSYTFCSLWGLSQVFDGFWKNFHKKVCPVTRFVRCGDYLKFWMGLRKVSTKMCAQLHVLFAVETILSFGWDLENFSQKSVPSYTFCSLWRLKFLDWDLKFFEESWKVSTKRCDQLHNFFAVQTISSFWWDLEKFSQKKCPVTRFVLCGDYLKNFHEKVCPVTRFVRCGDYFKFWMALRKIPTNMCPQLHVFSQCRLSQVFDGTWKTFHKKVCPVTRFVRCGDYLKFLMGLRKVSTKKCAQSHVSSLWRLS